MTNTEHLLRRTKIALGKTSEYALAKALHMSQSQLAAIRKGKHGLGPKAVVRIAEITGLPERDVLVMAEQDKAKSPDEIEFWGRRSPRITASVAIAAVAFYAAVTGQDAKANTCTNAQPQPNSVYIMRSILTCLRKYALAIVAPPRGFCIA